jgi:hypothetical protein
MAEGDNAKINLTPSSFEQPGPGLSCSTGLLSLRNSDISPSGFKGDKNCYKINSAKSLPMLKA